MSIRQLPAWEYARKKLTLQLKLWLVRQRVRHGARTRLAAESGPHVLDRLRSNQAARRRVDTLLTREDDLVQALQTLALTQSPFFGR